MAQRHECMKFRSSYGASLFLSPLERIAEPPPPPPPPPPFARPIGRRFEQSVHRGRQRSSAVAVAYGLPHGGSMPAVLNAANAIAVEALPGRRTSLTGIERWLSRRARTGTPGRSARSTPRRLTGLGALGREEREELC